MLDNEKVICVYLCKIKQIGVCVIPTQMAKTKCVLCVHILTDSFMLCVYVCLNCLAIDVRKSMILCVWVTFNLLVNQAFISLEHGFALFSFSIAL